jgi:hypothetical protein
VQVCRNLLSLLHVHFYTPLKYGLHTMHIKATERRIKLPCTVIQSFFEITVRGDF